jgi:hypothetical protein
MMVPDHRAGTVLRCPRCGVELHVPGVSVAAKWVHAEARRHADEIASRSESADASPGQVHNVEMASATTIAERAIAPTVAETLAEPPLTVAPPLPPSITAGGGSRAKGWRPPANQAAAAFYLSFMLAALAIFGVSPAVWEWFELWRNPDQPPVPPWVFALLITGVLQLAYSVYLAQIPDWSALWATTIATLAAAAAWAALLGTTLLGRDESALVMLFRYADKLAGNRAAMWCFIMLCLSSVLAYFLGHTAVRWQRSYRLLRRVREG